MEITIRSRAGSPVVRFTLSRIVKTHSHARRQRFTTLPSEVAYRNHPRRVRPAADAIQVNKQNHRLDFQPTSGTSKKKYSEGWNLQSRLEPKDGGKRSLAVSTLLRLNQL